MQQPNVPVLGQLGALCQCQRCHFLHTQDKNHKSDFFFFFFNNFPPKNISHLNSVEVINQTNEGLPQIFKLYQSTSCLCVYFQRKKRFLSRVLEQLRSPQIFFLIYIFSKKNKIKSRWDAVLHNLWLLRYLFQLPKKLSRALRLHNFLCACPVFTLLERGARSDPRLLSRVHAGGPLTPCVFRFHRGASRGFLFFF